MEPKEMEQAIGYLERFLKGDHLSSKEKVKVHMLLSDNADNPAVEQWLLKYWEETPQPQCSFDYDKVLTNLLYEIGASYDIAASPKIVSFSKRFFHHLEKIAAILFLPLLIGMSIYIFTIRTETDQQVAFQDISTIPGTRTHIVLPDSTDVWLNAASNIRFPSKFSKDQRNVYLRGEAYFKVKKDHKRPFKVHANQHVITALGTSFNVRSYPGELPRTILVEGKIKVNPENEEKNFVMLNPNQSVNLDGNEFVIRNEVNIEDNIAWKEGVLQFDEVPLKNVVVELERWYGVSIRIKDTGIANYKITARIKDKSIEQILRYISISSSVNVKEVDGRYIVSRNQ